MLKKMIFVTACLLLFLTGRSFGEDGANSSAWFDFGVFSYEDGHYEEALKHFQKALDADADNPLYHHFMGKTLLKLSRNNDALIHLQKALDADAALPELKKDTALAYFNMENYAESAALFSEVSDKNPSDVLTTYRAGISYYKLDQYYRAMDYLIIASSISPTVMENGFYYLGVCNYKIGKIRQADEFFSYLVKQAESPVIKKNSRIWLDAVESRKKAMRPFRMYARLSRIYDDNARLTPDTDTEIISDIKADDSDWMTAFTFSGRYTWSGWEKWMFGAGYNHYQTWYDDLSEYDLMGSMFNVSAKYIFHPFSVNLAYLPVFYWVDGEHYLSRHQLRPGLTWHVRDDLTAELYLLYGDNTYHEDDYKNGETREIGVNGRWNFLEKKGRIWARTAYEDTTAEDSDQAFTVFKTAAGLSYTFPGNINCGINLSYNSKEYEDADAVYRIRRQDYRYGAGLSASRHIYYDWLMIEADYKYLKNDANILKYEFEQNTFSLSLSVTY